MRCTPILRFLILCSAAVGIQQRCKAQGSIPIPKVGDGYQITKTDGGGAAPAGYEGRTDTATETAVGNTPATAGKRVVAKFTLSNQIKTCPQADGTAEGTGLFSVSVDYTDAQANGTSTAHAEMSAKAKYKGQVGDDALLHGPVNAEIDYTYSQTGSFRGTNGAIASSPPSNVQQHITIPVVVMPGMKPPDFGPFSGGDPVQAHYAEAFGAGMALSYWAGVYYSIAELKWYGGEPSSNGSVRAGVCVQIAFDPPSNTLQPPLGENAKVNAVVKTKSGESVPGNFVLAHAYSGMISPTAGKSDTSSPLHFIYTAPSQQSKNAGFQVAVLSRAGTAEARWDTGLGTAWSGQITYYKTYTGDQGHYDLADWATTVAESVKIDVKNGVATYSGHVEHKYVSESRHGVAHNGGAITFEKDGSDDNEGTGDGTYPATVTVNIDEVHHTYEIKFGEPTDARGLPTTKWQPLGKEHWTRCTRGDCQTSEMNIEMPGIELSGPLSGPLQDPNHIQASDSERKESLGRARNGVMVRTTTVNLARSGHTNRSSISK